MVGHELISPTTMHKTENSKLNLHGKLRLKRNNSDSTQDISNTWKKNSSQVEDQLKMVHDDNHTFHKENSNLKFNSEDNEEDSLADFKSPKQESVKSKSILNKFKIDTGKTKKKITISKNKPSVKPRKSDANQPSIEASLLKPQISNRNQDDIKEAVPCPVCLKPFKDDTTCSSHMKSCAAKNNVSIKQLLEAKRLQDRQAQERKAIGLLAAPIIPEKKKAFRSKHFSTSDDPQLQLVLAMSESLYEAERIVELEEAAFLAGIPTECIKEMNDEDRKKTLQSFGFTTTKPIADIPTNKQRKKKLLGPTVLQTRSKEDRDRVLTERIACILTGEDALTQVQSTAINFESKTPTSIISKLLKTIEKTEDKLWDKSRLTKQFHNFYVNELKSYFSKSPNQPVESETRDLLVENCQKQSNQSLNNSIVYEPMNVDVIVNNQEVEQDTSICEIFNMNEIKSENFEQEFVENCCNNWRESLNNSAASDVLIFVKNHKRIYAHKLVFHIQCPNILLDIEPLDTVLDLPIDKKICWLDKEKISALAFLEFVYSGTISKYINIFYQEELVHQVEQLARLYKKQNLFTYIRRKQRELRRQRKNSEQLENYNDMQGKTVTNSNEFVQDKFSQKSSSPQNRESIPLETQVSQNNSSIYCSSNELETKNRVSNNFSKEQLIDRRITASPDLFDSEEDEADCSRILVKNNLDSENGVSTNSNIKEEMDNAQELEHLNSQNTIVNLSRSVSPLENMHEAITPPSGRSPERYSSLHEENRIFNEEEIAEAVTPKCQSPEQIDDIKQEIIKIDNLCSAVTPEYFPPTEENDCVTPKKLVYAGITLNDVTSQDQIDESIYNAVTPPRLQEESRQMIDENIHKVKSELTMFIEKVQRRNAKEIMDTDSETDSPDIRVRHKNPFLKRDQDDSYGFIRCNRDQKHHKAISLLEKDLLGEQTLLKYIDNVEIDFNGSLKNSSDNLRNDNPSTSELQQVHSGKNLTYFSENTREEVSLSDDEIQDITVNETELSMYTKYKKSNEHDNSIDFYRKQLDFDGQNICANDKVCLKSIAEENLSRSNLLKTSRSIVSENTTVRKPKPRIIEDTTLVCDSDEEESPLRTFLKDKNKKKTYRKSPDPGIINKESKVDIPTLTSNIENDGKFPLLKNDSKNNFIDLSVDSDEGSIHDDSTISDNSLGKTKSFVMELQDSIDKRKELEEAEKKGEDIDAEISKILESSQKIITIDENLNSDEEKVNNKEELNDNNANTRALRSKHKLVDLSPISIVSSPEHCEFVKTDSQKSKISNVNDNKHNNYSQNSEKSLTLEENGDFDLLAINDWNIKTPPKETVRSKRSLKESSRASQSSRRLNYDDLPLRIVDSSHSNVLSNLKNDKASTLITSPILSKNRANSVGAKDKISKIGRNLKKKGASPENSPEDARKLKVKAASTSTLTEKMKENDKVRLQRSSSFVTPEQNNKCPSGHKDLTPPLDYSLLDTPNLQKELRKFGLKPQIRTKAKALLTHIYKETHSQPSTSQKRTSSTDSSSEEVEPPAKKPYIKKVTKISVATNRHSAEIEKRSDDCSVIAEEMDFDDEDVASVFQNPVSIKDAFFTLIKTNTELYNQVLTYEPLKLENLHATLKQNGFKCPLNSLMDFLDEQCITFQVKANNGHRIKK